MEEKEEEEEGWLIEMVVVVAVVVLVAVVEQVEVDVDAEWCGVDDVVQGDWRFREIRILRRFSTSRRRSVIDLPGRSRSARSSGGYSAGQFGSGDPPSLRHRISRSRQDS